MRIQQQQRAAQDSFKNMDNDSSARADQIVEDWYSDDEDDDDDDDDEGGNLTIVDSSKDEIEPVEKNQNVVVKEEFPSTPPASNVPQPAAIVDKLGDLSKFDISAQVSKLLSTIKAQSSTSNKTQQAANSSQDASKTKSAQDPKPDSEVSSSPRLSPGPSSVAAPVSRDPRMSRDPRQRREVEQKPSSPSISDPKRESQKPLRLETSIYSSGITAMDANMDTDLRTRADQDLRRQDMDLRQRFQTSEFGDTDLRVKSDVDLRQILSLPFKPAPAHKPCTEIDASIASHPPMPYKVYVVDIPRPDYTGLKLTKEDAQVKYDPRLRKIFRIVKPELADSPMSPPPPMKQDTPKSPPQCAVRTDPRRKTLEAAASNQQSSSQNTINASKGMQPQPMEAMGPNMGLGPAGMQVMGPPGMPGPPPPGGMMGPMGPNYPIGMGPMRPMMNPGPMPPPMGMPHGAGGMGMNGPVPMPSQNQMNFDPRFNVQRNNGAGLLGPAPVTFGPDNSYEGGPPYPPCAGSYNNFGGPGGGGTGESGMMGFNPNGTNGPGFGPGPMGDDWGPGSNRQRGGRLRRNRNRNRTNMVTNN